MVEITKYFAMQSINLRKLIATPVDPKAFAGPEQNTENVKRGLYTHYHQDGVIDVALGLAFIILSATLFADQDGILIEIALVLYFVLKRTVTRPRLGYVRFNVLGREGKALLIVIGTALLLGLGLSFLVPQFPSLFSQAFRDFGFAIFGVLLALMFAAVAALYRLRRFLTYSGMVLAVFMAGQVLKGEVGLYMLVPGLVLLACGAGMLVRFVRTHPIAEEAPA